MVGSACPTCLVDFRSRVRLLRHLTHGGVLCVAAVRDGLLPPADPEAVTAANELDRLDRAARRRLGLRDCQGPAVRRPVLLGES